MVQDDKTSILLQGIQSIPAIPADEKPYDDSLDGHLAQDRSDQFFEGDTTITNGVTGHIFTSKVTIGGNDKWTEEWVVEDEAQLKAAVRNSGVVLQCQYQDTNNNSASYITALQATPASSTAVSMSVDFYYETFDMNASPVNALPKGIAGTLQQVTFKVYSATIDPATGTVQDKHHTGWLFRLHRQEAAGLLHADHWVLYEEYVLPSSPDMGTILEEAGVRHASAWHFCDNADKNPPDNKDGTAKQTAKWFVRTQAIYQSI